MNRALIVISVLLITGVVSCMVFLPQGRLLDPTPDALHLSPAQSRELATASATDAIDTLSTPADGSPARESDTDDSTKIFRDSEPANQGPESEDTPTRQDSDAPNAAAPLKHADAVSVEEVALEEAKRKQVLEALQKMMDGIDGELTALGEIAGEDGVWPGETFDGNREAETVTATALLAFLGAGYAPAQNLNNHELVQLAGKATRSLLKAQRENGSFTDSIRDNAIITVALAESYGMSGIAEWVEPLSRAADYIESTQNVEGGWPMERAFGPSDILSSGWNILALKSMRTSGIDVTAEKFELAKSWILTQTNPGTGIVYTGRPELATAVGLVMRVLAGRKTDTELDEKSVRVIVEAPERCFDDMEFCYWGGLAVFQRGGKQWAEWRQRLLDRWGEQPLSDGGGSVMRRAHRLLQLEILMRYESTMR